MKNKILLFFFSLFLSGSLLAQNGRIGQHDAISSWKPSLSSNFASVSEASSIAQDIMKAVGQTSNFQIREANVPNAAAVLYMGKRYILYNPGFISKLTRATGTKWAAISVLAHEIGHHQSGHTAKGSQLASELQADEFSGFALRKMGATLSEAQAAMKVIGNERGTTTHPAADTRLASIAKGWRNAGGQVEIPNTDIAKTTPQQHNTYPVQNSRRTVLADRNILANVRFNADPNNNYYITNQYNIVKISNAKLFMVGKLAKLNSSQYPYMMYDENNTRFYVTARGNIINKAGRNVGMVKAFNRNR